MARYSGQRTLDSLDLLTAWTAWEAVVSEPELVSESVDDPCVSVLV
jgi:hypothetical protein